MRDLLYKVRNSEFLTFNEALKVKVTLVMIFLLFFGSLTVPISFFEDIALSLRIVVPSTFFILFVSTFILLSFDKSRVAMHLSIYTFLGLTYYYVDQSGQLYGYFLFFITLTVIIFYQDITTYILYGGILTAYGVYYIHVNESLMVDNGYTLTDTGPVIYQTILIAFFLVYLVQFILTDSINDNLNTDYLKTKKINERYKDYVFRYLSDIEDRERLTPIKDNVVFQDSVKEISYYIYKNSKHVTSDTDIEEVVEFYFFLHKQNINDIIERDSLSSKVKKYAEQFQKYLIYRINDLDTLLFKSVFYYKKGIDNDLNRYNTHFDDIFSNKTNRILGLAIVYIFLTNEITQIDQWGRIQKILTHQEVKALFKSKEMRQVLSFEDINFFLKNEELFKRYL